MASGILKKSDHATAMIDACRKGEAAVVKQLIHKGADIDHQDNDGLTPLHYASQQGHVAVFKVLIESGANSDMQAKSGLTAHDYALKNGHTDIAKVLAVFKAASISAKASHVADTNVQPLPDTYGARIYTECRRGNLMKVRELVEKITPQLLREVLMNRMGTLGYTALHEAVANGKPEILRYLLEQAANANVNCRANDGYTPLHIAASHGQRKCAEILLEYGADMYCTDLHGKTAKQGAKGTNSVVKLLHSEEIIKEVESNGENIADLLRDTTFDNLEPGCLDRALQAAVKNDNAFNVGKLVVKGAMKVQECLRYAEIEKKHNAHALLLMIVAAQTGDVEMIHKLFGEPAPGFIGVQMAVRSDSVSTLVPIEIARRNGQIQVREELLLKTDVNQEEGCVYWHGLRLLDLELSWLRKIAWVKTFRLARNGFKVLPKEMGYYLKQVVKLDLQHNELTKVPKCLLELPSLRELNLSHNKLTEIPVVEEWPSFLVHLDLSNNELKNLPLNAVAPAIRSLDLSCNLLRDVPDCVCSFTTLQSLDISDNPRIKSLPAEMGQLFHLSHLNLKGLKDLSDPPRGMQADCHDCIRYLNVKLRNERSFYHMKLLLVGSANSGKTTLITYLRAVGNENRAMLITDVSHWSYRPSFKKKNFHFNVWDFKGGEEYYTTQCFLSQNSLYLLLFNLKQGDKGVEELRPWLDNIALRAPHSRVIIVGTHLDEVPDEERTEIKTLFHRVGMLAGSYNNKLQIVEVLAVGLKNRIENVSSLKEAIYKHSASYENQAGQLIMGQKVPTSYHILYRHLQEIQHEVRQGVREPIMHTEAFRTMVHKMNLVDIQDDEEMKMATKFLVDVGSLLHYSNQGHHLNELYFIDPLWLWQFLSKFVKESEPLVSNGILSLEDFPTLFRDSQFPAQYSEQYLTLLKTFEIAVSINSQQVLIPSMLPDKRLETSEDEKPDSNELLYSRLILFSAASTTPCGFWSHLLSRIMQSVSKVCHALERSAPASNPAPSSSKEGHNHELKARNEIRGETSVEDSPTSISAAAPSPFTTPQQSIHSSDRDDSLNDKEVHLDYWHTGLYYRDSEIMFRIESLAGKKQRQKEMKDGVLLTVFNNTSSKKIVCELVDIVVSVVGEWYPGLQESSDGSNGIKQKVACLECIKEGREKPFLFEEKHWVPVVGKSDTIKCGYFHDDPDRNHTVSLADVVPDLLLQDIDPHGQFFLDTKELDYKEDDTSLLGEGDYGKVYQGQYKERSVAIKKYLLDREDAFTKLRLDAKALQQYQHACFVSLVGVCIYPTIGLVLEQPPLESLEFLLFKKKVSIHQLTVFRITAEVAAALRFLHNRHIIFHDLSAAKVLVWTLDPDSLCHVKLTNFDVAAHLGPSGARGLRGKKKFIASEVLHITGAGVPRSSDAHKVDIFSFGMLLYQLIAHKYPYYSIPLHEIDLAKETGEHPSLKYVYAAHTGYHYLTQIMKACWERQPNDRPETDAIIKKVCLLPAQTVMCVAPVNTSLEYLCQALAITPSDYAKAGFFNRLDSELWVCCDGDEGAEINMTRTNTMGKMNKAFIKDNQVQCMALCGDHVWVASMAGIKYGSLDIFNIGSRELIHNIRMRENSTSCIASTDKRVYLGTREGYCFSFTANISEIRANARPKFKYVSEHGIDGIVCTQNCVWVAHTRYIHLLNFDSLTLEGPLQREQEQDACIGQLFFDPEHNVVWSAHIGGTILSAWNSSDTCHKYDIDAGKHLNRIASTVQEHHLFITAMTPALDTVWVGMASGHIMVFHEENVLTWFHPYEGYVRFLTYIPSAGPCEMEKAMIVSGGKDFKPLIEDLQEKQTEGGEGDSVKGTLVMWEAYEAKTIRQMKLIEDCAPDHLNNHSSVCKMIQQGNFSDGTLVLASSVQTLANPNSDTITVAAEIDIQPEESNSASLKVGNAQSGNADFPSSTSGDDVDSKVPAVSVEDSSLNRDLTENGDNHVSVVPNGQ